MSVFYKTIATVICYLITLSSVAQRQDTTQINYYKVGEDATLNLELQHTELNIIEANNDSIMFKSSIKVIPSNPNTPFAGINIISQQKNISLVRASVLISKDIEPQNELKSTCTVAIPQGTNLIINSRFGIINLEAKAGKIICIIDYINFNAQSLSAQHRHKIVANYSTIALQNVKSQININGENINLKADTIAKLKTNTRFSVFDINKCNTVVTQSYTDQFRLNTSDSITIEGDKSICLIDTVDQFLQSEIMNGALNVKYISPEFNAINIANTHSKTSINIDSTAQFTINADMRYCKLLQERLTLQKITSPSGQLYSGYYGDKNEKTSNISLISSYGDVTISFK